MQQTRVWDLAVRLFHWALVALVLLGWLSGENEQASVHSWVGYVLLSLLLFRLLWGVIGSDTARFGGFLRSPAAARDHLLAMLRGRPPHYTGHNPAGGWMVVILMTLLTLQVVSGLFAADDDIAGPFYPLVGAGLAGWIAEYHEFNFNLLMLAVVVHVAAVLYHDLFLGEGLVRAMWHGRKRIEGQPPRMRPLWLAALAMLLAAGVVWGLLSQAPAAQPLPYGEHAEHEDD